MIEPVPMIDLGYENVRIPKPITMPLVVRLDLNTYLGLARLAAEENRWAADKANELIKSFLDGSHSP